MILVTGASGSVGGELTRQLVDAGQQVRGLTRDHSAALPDGVERAVGDLNRPESLSAALDGARGVFLLSGYKDTPRFLAEARRAGVERVVLLSSGAVVNGEISNAITRYNILAEEAVRECGLAWTILRPSGYMSNALRWLPQLRSGDVVREPFADVPIAAIDPFDIAAVATRALTDPGHERRSYRLTGPEATLPATRVRLLGITLGRQLRFERQADDDARTEMSDAGVPDEYIAAFFRYFAHGTYDDSRIHSTVREVTGRAPRTFEQWAAAHADAFT
jgi:uncharacterized protein YbjT (DUF2867 family)